MLEDQPRKGDLVHLPQNVELFRLDKENKTFLYRGCLKKPSIAVFIENYNETFCKVFIEDEAGYVHQESLFQIKEHNGD